MIYIKSKEYDTKRILDRIMGPNPLKLDEELLKNHRIPRGATAVMTGFVLDFCLPL